MKWNKNYDRLLFTRKIFTIIAFYNKSVYNTNFKVSAPANFAHFCIIFSGYFMDNIYMSLHWQYSPVLEELEYIKINYVMSPKRC